MKAIILDEIPFDPSPSEMLEVYGTNQRASISILDTLAQEAQSIARPRGGYLVSIVDERGSNYVIIDGFRIQSRVVRINLDKVKRVFPYIATCGGEIEDWASSQTDPIRRFWANNLCEQALRAAASALTRSIENRLQTGPTYKVNPGSTIDWPLEGQRELFSLLGQIPERTGVNLAENLWMHPTMSTSGIRYPSEEAFENCSLCSREACRLRKAPYQEGLYTSKYAGK
jgi:hypothetical protein